MLYEIRYGFCTPPFGDLSFEFFVIDHFAAGGFVGFAVFIGKVKLNKPIVVKLLGEGL